MKRTSAVFIIVVMVFLLNFAPVKCENTFLGAGTEEDPYIISSAKELYLLTETCESKKGYKDSFFVLTEDIILNDTSSWRSWETNSPKNKWTPIGAPRTPFEGTFDGQGHTVTGMYASEDKNGIGLFGYTKEAVIKNVRVEKSFASGISDVGLIVGMSDSSYIFNVSSEGYVSGKYNIGGIAGQNNRGRIENALSKTAVTADKYAGGIVGYNYKGKIKNGAFDESVSSSFCSGGIAGINDGGEIFDTRSNGDISSENYAGGITGYNLGENSIIKTSYSSGEITAERFSGGIAGANTGKTADSFSKGKVSGEFSGGVIGINYPYEEETKEEGIIENCYYVIGKALSGTGYDGNEDITDITDVKASSLTGNYIVRYVLFGEFKSFEDLEENDGNVWVFDGKEPKLYFENLHEEPEAPEEEIVIGEKIGEVLSTDIRVYIDGNEIQAYNIGGKMAVALKDLRAYGFCVDYDEKQRRVDVTYTGEKITADLEQKPKNTDIGSYIADVISTDIKTFLNNSEVLSFNVGGFTHVYLYELSCFGNVTFDEERRIAYLKTE